MGIMLHEPRFTTLEPSQENYFFLAAFLTVFLGAFAFFFTGTDFHLRSI
jgi:hypothetical protein